MSIPTSGTLTLNTFHTTVGGGSGSSATLNDTDIRRLSGRTSGTISFSHFYGASYIDFNSNFYAALDSGSLCRITVSLTKDGRLSITTLNNKTQNGTWTPTAPTNPSRYYVVAKHTGGTQPTGTFGEPLKLDSTQSWYIFVKRGIVVSNFTLYIHDSTTDTELDSATFTLEAETFGGPGREFPAR